MQKAITFGIPCYNSADYMDNCITSILKGSEYADDVHIVIVDDGSTDKTPAKVDEWHAAYPDTIDVVHQANGGHGMAVLSGLKAAKGTYYKVVDSDDWLDAAALRDLLALIRDLDATDTRVDLIITNYVYEHVEDDTRNAVGYHGTLPQGKVMGWDDIGHFSLQQNLLMHSLCYRTDVLRGGALPLPPHTFYVDNIYAYVPLPWCETLYYLDVDLYRYFIGREDQSVNEQVMAGRIDQQIRITRIMMHAYHLYDDIESSKLRSYMVQYFVLMMAICSIFSKISDSPEAADNLRALWLELKNYDHRMYRRARRGMVGTATNLPGETGTKVTLGIYHIAQKVGKFN